MYISRDPFARSELHKEIVKTEEGCDWCGQKHKGKLFHYYVEPDRVNYRRDDIKGNFCSISCMRSFSGT